MTITITEHAKAPVYVDRQGERDIVARAFDGIVHAAVQTEDILDRTDFLVTTDFLTTYVVEVKDRALRYPELARMGPLIDTSKAEAVAERANRLFAHGVIFWRTTDGFLVGVEAKTVLEHGRRVESYQRTKGDRPQDTPKSVHVIGMEHCYVRPPSTVKPGRLERDWLQWLARTESNLQGEN